MRRLLALLLLAGSAAAQEAVQPLAPQRSPVAREALADLAYVLGQAHALRTRCEGEAEQVWRGRMLRMVAVERPDEAFREQLFEGFNTGFLGARAAHPSCDARARAAYSDVATRGRDLSRSLATVQ